jgi:hypothetical protein
MMASVVAIDIDIENHREKSPSQSYAMEIDLENGM